ncbi:hypothetical protein D6158_27385 [Nocardia seriolae]|nr:hypothetical protein C6575_27805 [Nocardia seriolae]RLP28814.1 hypothetical protein D6158_27385 [Nocardia seriolae]BAW08700.1 conserved hypothetical protein [Nocardia seriolae]
MGVAALALLGAGGGTASADALTLSDVDISPGSAADLGNAVGTGSVDVGSAALVLGGAFGSGYAGGALGEILSSLSAR